MLSGGLKWEISEVVFAYEWKFFALRYLWNAASDVYQNALAMKWNRNQCDHTPVSGSATGGIQDSSKS